MWDHQLSLGIQIRSSRITSNNPGYDTGVPKDLLPSFRLKLCLPHHTALPEGPACIPLGKPQSSPAGRGACPCLDKLFLLQNYREIKMQLQTITPVAIRSSSRQADRQRVALPAKGYQGLSPAASASRQSQWKMKPSSASSCAGSFSVCHGNGVPAPHLRTKPHLTGEPQHQEPQTAVTPHQEPRTKLNLPRFYGLCSRSWLGSDAGATG